MFRISHLGRKTHRYTDLLCFLEFVMFLALSIFLYASESWTLHKQMEDTIHAFKIWIFRSMFRISQMDRKTNVDILEMAKAKQTLLRTKQERKLQYFGHLI